jgi:hypothetical protein
MLAVRHRRSLPAVLIATVLAATPAAALAQNAGDEQYADPFAPGSGQGDGAPAEQPSTPPAEQPSAPPAGGDAGQADPVPAPAPTPEPAPTETSTAAPAEAAQGPSLPRTGLPILPLAAVGLVLLVAGGALRRRA